MIFGMVILLVSIVLLFIPLFGGYLTVFPGIMAVFVGRKGALYALIGVIFNGMHLLLFSDFIRFNAVTGIERGEYRASAIYIGLALLQVIVGLTLWIRHYPVGIKNSTSA